MISIDNLTRRYGSVVAVNNVSTEIKRGEIVGLLGHNGAGKTTVMKVMTGYLEPTSGTVSVGGIDVTQNRIGVQSQIGYLPEHAPLYPEMLVQDYLLMMAEFRGVAEPERVRAVAEAALATGLEGHMVQPISALSKGYRQRVGLAQAIVHKPDVLVLDEPTNGLDPMQIQSIRTLIRRLGETATIILSTHILQEVEAVCDRVLIMIQGEIAADAPLDQMLRNDVVKLRVRVTDDTDIAKALHQVDGVRKVTELGKTSGDYTDYTIDCVEGCDPIPDIIQLGTKSGWIIGGITSAQWTLEEVFKNLQQEHIDRQGVTR
jgi:ABC-2 type transport system ATP-binding protein